MKNDKRKAKESLRVETAKTTLEFPKYFLALSCNGIVPFLWEFIVSFTTRNLNLTLYGFSVCEYGIVITRIILMF